MNIEKPFNSSNQKGNEDFHQELFLGQNHALRYAVLKKDNITLFFKGFENMFILSDFLHSVQQELNFEVVDNHNNDAPYGKFHEGIKGIDNSEAHFHLEYKKNITDEDISLLFKKLIENEFI